MAASCLGLLVLLCQIALGVQLLLDLLLEVLSMLLHIVLTPVLHCRRSEPQIAPAAVLRATNVNLVGRMGWQEANCFSIALLIETALSKSPERFLSQDCKRP